MKLRASLQFGGSLFSRQISLRLAEQFETASVFMSFVAVRT